MRKDDTIQIRVSSAEKAELHSRAELQHISLSELIRQRLKLDAQPTYAGKPAASDEPAWKKALPPT